MFDIFVICLIGWLQSKQLLLLYFHYCRLVSKQQINELKEIKWIDRQTRAVVVELTTYNTPTNLFTSIALLLELPSTGGAFSMSRIMSTYVFRYVTGWDSFVLSCEVRICYII